MSPRNDIHRYDLRLEQTLQRLEHAAISPHNKTLIRQFDRMCFLEGLGKPRRIRVLGLLIIFARDHLCKDLDKASKNNLQNIVMAIDGRSDCSPWTKASYKLSFPLVSRSAPVV